MGECGCKKKRQQFQVVVDGKTVYSSTSEATAKAVAKRYPGSEVKPSAPAGAAPAARAKPAQTGG